MKGLQDAKSVYALISSPERWTRHTKANDGPTGDKEGVTIHVRKTCDATDDCADNHRVAVETDTPAATKVVVDVGDEGSNDEAGKVTNGVEEAQADSIVIAESNVVFPLGGVAGSKIREVRACVGTGQPANTPEEERESAR